MDGLSIIIPVCNGEKFLQKCIESIITPSDHHPEIILVDDASADDSCRVIRGYQGKNPDIVLLPNKGKGVSAARNTGIAYAHSEWLYFMDQDDFLESGALDYIYENLKNDLFCFGYSERKNGKVHTIGSYSGKTYTAGRDELEKMFFTDNRFKGYIWNKCFRKSILERAGIRFDESLPVNEDALFCLQYLKQIREGRVLEKELYCYVKHAQSVMNGAVSEKYCRSVDAYGKMLQLADTPQSKKRVSTAYILMMTYLLKKGLKSGVQSKEIRDLLRHKIAELYENGTFDLKASEKRWVTLFVKVPLIYPLMRIKPPASGS